MTSDLKWAGLLLCLGIYHLLIKMPWNALGNVYTRGKVSSEEIQKRVLKYFKEGLSFRKISAKTGIHAGTCHKIVTRFQERSILTTRKNTGKKISKSTPEVVEFVEYCKTKTPSVYCREIQSKLSKHNFDVPCRRAINKIVNEHLGMSHKKLERVPSEIKNQDDILDVFLSETLDYNPRNIHFFDEASVIRTSGNRTYGHSVVGSRAIEFQKYSSNATFTINLSCGFYGIDYFNIVDGPSNAYEMLNFFIELLDESNDFGNPVYGQGDIVIMDNCGFHHHRQISRLLRNILRRYGVRVVFQPPYSPEFNAAEYAFHLMRNNLRDKTSLVQEYTELAIVEAVQEIPDRVFPKLFRLCGYV